RSPATLHQDTSRGPIERGVGESWLGEPRSSKVRSLLGGAATRRRDSDLGRWNPYDLPGFPHGDRNPELLVSEKGFLHRGSHRAPDGAIVSYPFPYRARGLGLHGWSFPSHLAHSDLHTSVSFTTTPPVGVCLARIRGPVDDALSKNFHVVAR